MRILFVCAGGMSTGLIVKKMEKWASENGKDLVVKATGVGGYESKWQDYDCILVGPQVRFKIPEMKEKLKFQWLKLKRWTMDYRMLTTC